MAVLHDHEKPDLRVFGSLNDALPRRCLSSVTHRVALSTLVCQSSLLGCQPVGIEGLVGQDEVSGDRDYERDCALKNE